MSFKSPSGSRNLPVPRMKIDVISLFPQTIRPALQVGILKRAHNDGALTTNVHDLRNFATDRNKSVDDYPYGGGAGMILKPEPLFAAVRALIGKSQHRVIYLTPQGKPFNQRFAEVLSLESHLILICGRYKGIDERVRENLVTDEISIGDYVLSGGEIPALVMIDAIARILPGVLGDYESAESDSFSQELLDHPHYTRPADFQGIKVPDILLSGNHEKVRRWKHTASLKRTAERRPDLLEQAELSEEEAHYLKVSSDDN